MSAVEQPQWACVKGRSCQGPRAIRPSSPSRLRRFPLPARDAQCVLIATIKKVNEAFGAIKRLCDSAIDEKSNTGSNAGSNAVSSSEPLRPKQ